MSEAEDARRDDGHRLFARALVKKLRAIELLKSRDAATLDPQQQLKLADESRLRAKLAAMGVDAPPSAPPVAPPAAPPAAPAPAPARGAPRPSSGSAASTPSDRPRPEASKGSKGTQQSTFGRARSVTQLLSAVGAANESELVAECAHALYWLVRLLRDEKVPRKQRTDIAHVLPLAHPFLLG